MLTNGVLHACGRYYGAFVDRLRIEHALVAKFERDRAGFAERHRAIETRATAGMAGAAALLDFDPDRILVAVDAHFDDALGVAGGLALLPQRAARAAEIPGLARWRWSSPAPRAFMCATISTSPGFGVGGDARDQPVGIELRRQRRAFFEFGGARRAPRRVLYRPCRCLRARAAGRELSPRGAIPI